MDRSSGRAEGEGESILALMAEGEVKVRVGSGLAGGDGEGGLLGRSTWNPTGCVMGKRGYIPNDRGFILLLAWTRGYLELGRRPRGTLGASRRLSMLKGLFKRGFGGWACSGVLEFLSWGFDLSRSSSSSSSPTTSISSSQPSLDKELEQEGSLKPFFLLSSIFLFLSSIFRLFFSSLSASLFFSSSSLIGSPEHVVG